MERCAFCDNDAVEHGGEHIWDDWLNKWLQISMHNFKYSLLHDKTKTRNYKARKLDEKLPVVCTSCNSGWMSHVTERVKTLVQYVIRDGAQICFLPSGTALLAAFTFMKAICADHEICEDREPFFTRAIRERLRNSLTIPPVGVRMWIGAFQGEARYSGRFVPAVLSSSNPRLAGVEFFTFTYVVGHLVLQLCAARWQQILHRGNSVIPMLKPDAYWDQAAIQFWPDNGSPVQWPPQKYFNDESMKEFINRFKLPVVVR